jgi:hypothetical protein
MNQRVPYLCPFMGIDFPSCRGGREEGKGGEEGQRRT